MYDDVQTNKRKISKIVYTQIDCFQHQSEPEPFKDQVCQFWRTWRLYLNQFCPANRFKDSLRNGAPAPDISDTRGHVP